MEFIGHISIAPIVPVAIYLIPVAIYMPVSIHYLICEVLIRNQHTSQAKWYFRVKTCIRHCSHEIF